MSGGFTGSDYIDTTEIYDGSIWTNVGSLPWKMSSFEIINIDNKILSFGIYIFYRMMRIRTLLARFYLLMLTLNIEFS